MLALHNSAAKHLVFCVYCIFRATFSICARGLRCKTITNKFTCVQKTDIKIMDYVPIQSVVEEAKM